MSAGTGRLERIRAPRPLVDSCSADELFRELVADGVVGYATPLDRFVRAVERIGKQRRCGAEEAYRSVRAEIENLRGRPGMPMI